MKISNPVNAIIITWKHAFLSNNSLECSDLTCKASTGGKARLRKRTYYARGMDSHIKKTGMLVVSFRG